MTRKRPKQKTAQKKVASRIQDDDFVSVARRLGADENKATFEAKLAKIVKHKPQKESKGG